MLLPPSTATANSDQPCHPNTCLQIMITPTSSPVTLYGAGGHAEVVLATLTAGGRHVIAVFDDEPLRMRLGGHPVDHGMPANGRLTVDLTASTVIVSIGANKTRASVAARLNAEFTTAVHPNAIVSTNTQIGVGTVVFHRAIVQHDTIIGQHVIVNTSAVIGPMCWIFDFLHVSPGATLGGEVNVGEGTHIGAAAVIGDGVQIGAWSTIGAGAIILHDVSIGQVIVGNPTRNITRNPQQPPD